MEGKKAIEGALKRMEERPANDLSSEKERAGHDNWGNWPDWSDSSDFPNWEDIG